MKEVDHKDGIMGLYGETGLERAVLGIIRPRIEAGDDAWTLFYNLLNYGVCMDVIPELVLEKDVSRFYMENGHEMMALLDERLGECRMEARDFIGYQWDAGDPLARRYNNRAMLAKWAFAETAEAIANKIGLEI